MVSVPLPPAPSTGAARLQRLDPRVRLLWLTSFFLLTVAAGKLIVLAVLGAWLLALAVASNGLGRLLRSLLDLAWIIAVVSLMNGWAYGLEAGVLTAAKFAVALAAFAVFFWVSDVDDLADALAGIGVPDRFAFVLTGGLALVPSVARELGEIVDAYRARGIPLDAEWWRRITVYPRLLFPLVVSTVGRALRLASALEVRGFGATPRRTPLRELQMRPPDWVAVGVIMGLTALILWVAIS